jgi:predicted nucleic acid-binding protein
LAAFALEGQAQLVTFDQGFRRFAGLDLQVLG